MDQSIDGSTERFCSRIILRTERIACIPVQVVVQIIVGEVRSIRVLGTFPGTLPILHVQVVILRLRPPICFICLNIFHIASKHGMQDFSFGDGPTVSSPGPRFLQNRTRHSVPATATNTKTTTTT